MHRTFGPHETPHSSTLRAPLTTIAASPPVTIMLAKACKKGALETKLRSTSEQKQTFSSSRGTNTETSCPAPNSLYYCLAVVPRFQHGAIPEHPPSCQSGHPPGVVVAGKQEAVGQQAKLVVT